MEATSLLGSASIYQKPPVFSFKSSYLPYLRSNLSSVCSNGFLKRHSSLLFIGQGRKQTISRRIHNCIQASSSDSTELPTQLAPLRLESPTGQLLSKILETHPYLLPAAVDQQLRLLETDRDSEKQKNEPSTKGTDLILYRRIAEVKANERKKVLEEILYVLIVEKFINAKVPLIPTLSESSDPSGRVDTWTSQEDKLQRLHSPEAYEMIKNHLALILGNRLGDSNSIAQISKIRVSQVYAASVMYGYFLKRVDQRFQLEKTMKTLTNSYEEDDIMNSKSDMDASYQEHTSWTPGGFGHGIKPCRLRSYVMSFDSDTLQRYAMIRSKEAVSIIEKHTESLFGKAEMTINPQATLDSPKEENIKISFTGLSRLVLEAVTFGSFLWDVETYVDMRYHFVTN